MRGILWVVALVALTGLAMAFTKPTAADVEAQIEADLLARIDAAEVEAEPDPVRAILMATCKMGRDQCARFIRSLIALDYEDKVLFARVRVSLGETQTAECIGVFTRILCRES